MRRTTVLLRSALAGCLLATVALAAGCTAPQDRALVVLGPWTDGEEKPFEKTLADIEKWTGRPIVYEGTRSLRETLVAQLQAGSPPDVAILNSPGELVEYARKGDLHPVPTEEEASRAIPPWAPRLALSGPENHAYWVPVRIDLKSIVWTRPAKAAGKQVGQWCLGMSSGAASGWPGTDWIEDLLLQQQGAAVYNEWATGKLPWNEGKVKDAWKQWGTLLTAPNGDRGKKALTTPFDELHEEPKKFGLLNRTKDRCTHEHQGSFISRHYNADVRPYPTTNFVDSRPDGEKVYEVSGDMAAVFKPSAAAWKLLSELTSPKARKAWVVHAGESQRRPFFPGWSGKTPEPDTSGTAGVQKLLEDADQVCFDASDAMPPTLRDAFYRAVLQFLGDPKDLKGLDKLLDQLDQERERQKNAFLKGNLCSPPPPTA